MFNNFDLSDLEIMNIIKKYNPLIIKSSKINYKYDEDLCQEIKLNIWKELSKNRKIKKVSSKDFTKEQINSIIEEGLGNGNLKDLELIDGNYKRKVKKEDTEAYKKYSKLNKETTKRSMEKKNL